MASLWKFLVLLHMCYLLVLNSAAEKSTNKEENMNDESLNILKDVDTSSSERFSHPGKSMHLSHVVNFLNYDIKRMNHKVDQLSLIIRQIIHSCPCARGISPLPCSNPWAKECRPFGFGHGQGSSGSNQWGSSSTGQMGGSSDSSSEWESSSGFGHWGNAPSSGHWGESSGSSQQWGGSSVEMGQWGSSSSGQGGSSTGHWGTSPSGQWGSSSGQWGGPSGSSHWGTSPGSGQWGSTSGSGKWGSSSGSGKWGSSGSGKWGSSGSGKWGSSGSDQWGSSGSDQWGDSSGSGQWGNSQNSWGSQGPTAPNSWVGGSVGGIVGLKNCGEYYKMGDRKSGIRKLYPFYNAPSRYVSVYCDQNTDNGGWTTILKREPSRPRVDFSRKWHDYSIGFGDINGEYWLGLENIHAITNTSCMELRVDLKDFGNNHRFAKYQVFNVADKNLNYALTVNGYNGNAGDSLSYSDGQPFSTKDKDLDQHASNCAKKFKGGWWYNSCFMAKLTGFPYNGRHHSYADGVNWKTYKGYNYSFKTATMNVRPVSCPDYHGYSANNMKTVPAV